MPTHELWEGREELGQRAEEEGERWFAQLGDQLIAYPPGTLIGINVDTGEFVTGATHDELLLLFRERFGEDVLGWVREVPERTVT